MAELDTTEKFLTGTWSYYQLHDFSLPCHGPSEISLPNFVKCFENFSPHCTLQITPYGFEHLLCAKLCIDIKPGTREAFAKAKARKRKASAKEKPATHRAKKRSSEISRPSTSRSRIGKKVVEEEETEEEEGHADEDEGIPRISRAVVLKICLDPQLDLLFASRRLPQWLLVCLGRCLGVAGNMELVTTLRGDARHILQVVSQRGGARNKDTSSQANMEHDWVVALQTRGRFFGDPAPVGPVTKLLGNWSNNFPTVSDITATYRKVPISSLAHPTADVDEAKLQECRRKLAELVVSSIRVQLSSPSVLHLYYNGSREAYQAQEDRTHRLKFTNVGVGDRAVETVPPTQRHSDSDDEAIEEVDLESEGSSVAARVATTNTRSRSKKKKKTRLNLEGVITDVPFFIQRLRAKGTFRPVLEYK